MRQLRAYKFKKLFLWLFGATEPKNFVQDGQRDLCLTVLEFDFFLELKNVSGNPSSKTVSKN
jgi:hypothetical protein